MTMTRREFGKKILLSTAGLGASLNFPGVSSPILIHGKNMQKKQTFSPSLTLSGNRMSSWAEGATPLLETESIVVVARSSELQQYSLFPEGWTIR